MAQKKYLDLDGLDYLWDKIIGKFVAKETGKGLSTNDFTTAEKTKLAGIESGAEVNVIEDVKVNGTSLSVANKAVNIQTPQYNINGNEYTIVNVTHGTLNNVSGAYLMYDDGSIDLQSGGFFPDMIGMSYASEQIIGTADDNAQTLISARVPNSAQDFPVMDGTADVGSSTKFALADHVHPTDTSRQAVLVSGTNIKTVNGQSLLGSGDLTVGGEANVIENISVNGVTGTIANKVASVTVDASDIEFDDQTGWYTGADVDSALYEVATGKQDAIEVISKTASDTSLTLVKDKFYVFPTMTTLAVTVTSTGMYTFRFTSGSTATTLTVTGATMPDSFTVEANKVYEINIYQGYGVASSWTAS